MKKHQNNWRYLERETIVSKMVSISWICLVYQNQLSWFFVVVCLCCRILPGRLPPGGLQFQAKGTFCIVDLNFFDGIVPKCWLKCNSPRYQLLKKRVIFTTRRTMDRWYGRWFWGAFPCNWTKINTKELRLNPHCNLQDEMVPDRGSSNLEWKESHKEKWMTIVTCVKDLTKLIDELRRERGIYHWTSSLWHKS